MRFNMNIAIYKPFKKLFFVDDRQDNAAWSYEIVNLSQILIDHGHEVFIVSESDLDSIPIEELLIKFPHLHYFPGAIKNKARFDRIILWCGSFDLDQYKHEIVYILSKMTNRLDLALTDAKLIPRKDYLHEFDTIYLQGTKQLYSDTDHCGGLSELLLYKHNYTKTIDESIAQKDIEFYFGGTERDRLDDFIEYVWRPGHIVTTKTKFFGVENRTPRDEFMKTLDRTKYSVVITDVENNKNAFISPRPYECYIHDIVAFFDWKYDPNHYYCASDDYRRVHNYKEMRIKMNELNENQELYKHILTKQRQAIKPEFVSGEYVYENLK